MNKEQKFSNMKEALSYLESLGYATNFVFEEGHLRNPKTEEIFPAEVLTINDIYRFEGESNPDDMAVVYAIEAENGTRGTLIDAFGTYGDEKLGEFVNSIPQDVREEQVVPNVLPSEDFPDGPKV